MEEKQTLILSEFARYRHITETKVKEYCENGDIEDATPMKKNWLIPRDASLHYDSPFSTEDFPFNDLFTDDFFEPFLAAFTYYNAPIQEEVTMEQVLKIYNNELGSLDSNVSAEDIVASHNHFTAILFVLNELYRPLDIWFIQKLHALVFNSIIDPHTLGELRFVQNPENQVYVNEVQPLLQKLLDKYNANYCPDQSDVDELMRKFMYIMPFDEGSNSIANLLYFKELLSHHIIPEEYLYKEELTSDDWFEMYLPNDGWKEEEDEEDEEY